MCFSTFLGFGFYSIDYTGQGWHIQISREYLPKEISFLYPFTKENMFAKVEKGTLLIAFFR